jgi:hypothetical protein
MCNSKSFKQFGVLVVMLFISLSSGCTYKTTSPAIKFDVSISEAEHNAFYTSVIEFAALNGLKEKKHSKSFASGKSYYLVEFYDSFENRVIKIHDLTDKKRFVVAFYSCEQCDLDKLSSSFAQHIEASLPKIKIKGGRVK